MRHAILILSGAAASVIAASLAFASGEAKGTPELSAADVTMTAPGTDVTVKDGETTVTAPYTTVKSNADRTNITVDAPHTSIKVDTDSRTVRIRVPYFSGDIRW